jgi:hypothetical protein
MYKLVRWSKVQINWIQKVYNKKKYLWKEEN